jgi:hypothetical protein
VHKNRRGATPRKAEILFAQNASEEKQWIKEDYTVIRISSFWAAA